MNRRARVIALTILAMVLLIAHGLIVPVLYTFTSGETARAEILECHIASKSTTCTGRWELPSGGTDSGGVTGAGTSDEGTTIQVRTSALGTYTDNIHAHLWVRCIWAMVTDSALIGAWIWIRRLYKRGVRAVERLRADTDAHSLLFAYDKNAIAALDGARYFTSEDVNATTTRLNDGLGDAAWIFSGTTIPHDIRRITLWHRDGTCHGYLEQSRSSTTTALHDPHGNHVGTITSQRQYGVPGFSVRDRHGREQGLILTGNRRLVVRIPRNCPEWWRMLVFAKTVAGTWLTTPVLGRT